MEDLDVTGRLVVRRASRPVQGTATVPGSKSVTNRALALGALADGPTLIRGPLVSDDTQRMAEVVAGMGAAVQTGTDVWRVAGTDGSLTCRRAELFVGQSGTTMRFGTTLAALCEGHVRLHGTADLTGRPVGSLVEALRAMGADIVDEDGHPPVTVRSSQLEGGVVDLDARGSSQFATALLLVSPYCRGGLTLSAAGEAAYGYVELTASLMAQFGVSVRRHDNRWFVEPGQRYRAADVVVAPDISAACHLWALAMATGGAVTVRGVTASLSQPDAALLGVFEQMGGRVVHADDGVTVHGPDRLEPVDVDLSDLPDQLPTVAALACLADGRSHVRGAQVARGHETDRIAALARELTKLDVVVAEHADGLTIDGGPSVPEQPLDPHHDHRLAMSFASLGVAVGDVQILDPACVQKTFPGFWDVTSGLGVEHSGPAAPRDLVT